MTSSVQTPNEVRVADSEAVAEGRVAPTGRKGAASPGCVVSRVEGVPAPSERHLDPGYGVHGATRRRHAHVPQMARGRYVHAAAERPGEVSESHARFRFDSGTLLGQSWSREVRLAVPKQGRPEHPLEDAGSRMSYPTRVSNDCPLIGHARHRRAELCTSPRHSDGAQCETIPGRLPMSGPTPRQMKRLGR